MKLEEGILEGCLKRQAMAEHRLYQLSFPVLIKVCYRYAKCKDDALDLVNQGFLKIMNNLNKYDTAVPYDVWIRKIMVNVIIDEFRKNKNYKSTLYLAEKDELETAEAQDMASGNEGESRLQAAEVMECIRQLPPVTREVLNLNAIDGYTHREIAEMLGISENASRWHLHSARIKLKKMFEELETKTYSYAK